MQLHPDMPDVTEIILVYLEVITASGIGSLDSICILYPSGVAEIGYITAGEQLHHIFQPVNGFK